MSQDRPKLTRSCAPKNNDTHREFVSAETHTIGEVPCADEKRLQTVNRGAGRKCCLRGGLAKKKSRGENGPPSEETNKKRAKGSRDENSGGKKIAGGLGTSIKRGERAIFSSPVQSILGLGRLGKGEKKSGRVQSLEQGNRP